MRRSTIIGCFVGLFALTMNAQITQPSTSKSNTGTTNVEMQKKPVASIQELLARYNNVGSQSGSLTEYFSKEEQQMLHSYFSNQRPAKSNQIVKGVSGKNTVLPTSAANAINPTANTQYTPLFMTSNLKDNSEEARGIIVSPENRTATKQQAPLFLAPKVFEGDGEILAAAKRGAQNLTPEEQLRFSENVNGDASSFNPQGPQNSMMPPCDFATEITSGTITNELLVCGTEDLLNSTSVTPFCNDVNTGAEVPAFYGDGFEATYTYTPGSDGLVTLTVDNTTWAAIFVYDGCPSSGGTCVVATRSTTATRTVNFNAIEGTEYFIWIDTWPAPDSPCVQGGTMTFSGPEPGGGGGGSACSQSHPFGVAAAGGSGSSVDSTFKTASDIVVAVGEDFTLDTIEVPFLTFAPNDPPTTANIVYYEDAGGLPGTMIGSETVVPTILSSAPWANPVAIQFMTSLAVTPFTFAGDAGSDTTYWIEISMGTATNQATVFWEYTNDIPVEGQPKVQFDSTIGTWSVQDPTHEVIYTYSGDCEPIGGGGSACSQADASNAFENGYGNTNNTVEIGDEIIVEADTDFEVNQLTINMINNGGFNSIDVAFYEDAGGMPGTMIGSIMTIVPTSSTVIGTAFGRDVLSIVLDIAPVMLNGTSGSETVYWIGVETPNPINPASDAYWETTSLPNAGTDYRVHYDVANGGWTPTLPVDGMWNTVYTVSGNCEPIGGGGGILDTAYGVNNSNIELIGFPVSDPSTVEVFGDSPVTVNFENAGAIDPANPTTGYVLDNGGQFYSFDVASGFYVLLGNIPGDWVGMEFDQSTGILYAIAGADLYTIDPVAVTATLVGATGINPADLPIALAIDGAGVGYTYELVTDSLYSIDLATGIATLVGNIGFDANFGQGMCYDALTDTVYMAAFNSITFAAEWRSVNKATGATTLIGPIVTTAATTQVAWVSIGETLPPPACPEPTNLTVSNVTPDSADLSWDAEPNASSGYIWYVFDQGANPVTDTPVATGTTPAGTTTATATGLGGGFTYDFYVVADCNADGLSQYAGPITFATPPACGGKFYDTGGPGGDYDNNENVTTVISPVNAGEQVTVTFTAFDVETAWDALYVYDGPDASFPIISSGNPQTNGGFPAGGYYGTTIPGPFVSSDASGALTFVFMSDGSVPRAGWEADVTCALSPPPNDMIVNSIDVDEIGFPYTDPAVHMPAATTEDGNPAGCDLTGANGVWYNFVPAGDGTATAMIVTPGGASSVTFYTAPDENSVETDLVLVPQNSNQCLPGTSASIFTLAGQAYYVFVLNSGAVTDIVIDGTNLGTADNTIAGFSYYPNPTTGVLNLKS
ncbi:MAG: CUB domain-containing protein, partial [Aequorivita sp.]|nr:CUB domain-containing protein [Aequorivita sp.]